jgi:hypothetical protein
MMVILWMDDPLDFSRVIKRVMHRPTASVGQFLMGRRFVVGGG